MITDLFFAALGFLIDRVAELLDLFDVPDPAASIGQATSAWGQLVGFMSGAAGWFPFDIAVACVGVVAALGLAAVGVKFVRIVASFLTLGGGSAA